MYTLEMVHHLRYNFKVQNFNNLQFYNNHLIETLSIGNHTRNHSRNYIIWSKPVLCNPIVTVGRVLYNKFFSKDSFSAKKLLGILTLKYLE